MGPRIKHIYKSSNNRRSLVLFEKNTCNDNSEILQSLTSTTVRAQQEQVQKMGSDLQIRERKILQDISNLKNIPPPKPLAIPDATNVLPDDINIRSLHDETNSFIASPIIYKDTYSMIDEKHSFYNIDNCFEEENSSITHTAQSSSPSKVPGSGLGSNEASPEKVDTFEYEISNFKIAPISPNNITDIQSLASPISDKSICNQNSIEFFSIDPEFLQSFEGIWRKKLDHPIIPIGSNSPDHFSQIPFLSKGAKSRNNRLKRK